MASLDVSPAPVKAALAWAAEKAGRAKPNGQLRGDSPLGRLAEVEALVTGVSGKLSLWRALQQVAPGEPRLDTAGSRSSRAARRTSSPACTSCATAPPRSRSSRSDDMSRHVYAVGYTRPRAVHLVRPRRSHRRAVLELLLERPRPVGELVDRLGLTQPGTSKHLRVLREAGLVQVRQEAQRRVYAIDPGQLAELDVWLAPYRRLWNDSLDELGRHLDRMATEEE